MENHERTVYAVSNFSTVDDIEYDLSDQYKDEAGATLLDAKAIDQSVGEQQEKWYQAVRKEVGEIEDKSVMTRMTMKEIIDVYGKANVKFLLRLHTSFLWSPSCPRFCAASQFI